jgi:hypothetical protein
MVPEVNMAALGARLAYARRQECLRQADLAREVGIQRWHCHGSRMASFQV